MNEEYPDADRVFPKDKFDEGRLQLPVQALQVRSIGDHEGLHQPRRGVAPLEQSQLHHRLSPLLRQVRLHPPSGGLHLILGAESQSVDGKPGISLYYWPIS